MASCALNNLNVLCGGNHPPLHVRQFFASMSCIKIVECTASGGLSLLYIVCDYSMQLSKKHYSLGFNALTVIFIVIVVIHLATYSCTFVAVAFKYSKKLNFHHITANVNEEN